MYILILVWIRNIICVVTTFSYLYNFRLMILLIFLIMGIDLNCTDKQSQVTTCNHQFFSQKDLAKSSFYEEGWPEFLVLPSIAAIECLALPKAFLTQSTCLGFFHKVT